MGALASKVDCNSSEFAANERVNRQLADKLRDNIKRSVTPWKFSHTSRRQGDCRIHMCARDWSKREDKGDKRGASGEGVCKQSDSDVSACQAFPHDAGADHCRK